MVQRAISMDASEPSAAAVGQLRYASQRVAYPYLLAAALLFTLQVISGLLVAAQYVWPNFWLNVLPFNMGRATHVNLLIFWLLLGLMGASYYLVPEETKTELMSTPLAYVQFAIMMVAGLGTMISFWFLREGLLGKPFTESPMPWPILIALGVVLFLVNIGVTIMRSRHWTAVTVVLFVGMVGLTALYLIDFIFFPNLAVDYYWWWWIVHLWVENSWELITAAVMAFLLIKVTGAAESRIYVFLYAEVALVLMTGVLGIGHHYYWIGTPGLWLGWGAVFSALQPLPIALMTFDALREMRHRSTQPANPVMLYWLGGSAVGHLVGAGIWGFSMALPPVNQWTHGTQITASHGHFAFFGAFGLLVLAAIYYVLPRLKGIGAMREARSRVAFWLMSSGMIAMVLAFLFAGMVQVYLVRIVGLDFMTVRDTYTRFWMFWVFAFGMFLFTPGLIVFVWDFFDLRAAPRPTDSPGPVIGG